MSTTTAPPPPAATSPDGSTATSVGIGTLWRKARGPLAFLGVLVVLAVLLSLGAETTRSGPLEPQNPGPEGSRALIEIMRRLGTDVTVARDTTAAVTAARSDTVLVVASSHRLLPEELERLAGTPGDLLLVLPTTGTMKALAPGVRTSGDTDERTLAAACDLPAARTAGSADTGKELYAVSGDGATRCYPGEDGDALVQVPRDGGVTTVLGSSDPLVNERLDREGNAALALNLVGDRDVVWFLPEVPAASEGKDIWALLPRSFYLAVVPLGAALLLLAVWRGRRLGPLVAERLPVVVRASETTEGRARLYAARRARDRAAEALRSGLIGRMRPALGLGADSAPEAVVEAVSLRSGDDPARLRVLLYGPESGPEDDPHTADDAALVRLADELDALEERLR
ncbi:DUF4350 domain-containing protein [Nocardiopsis gilva YIM 90087]|uniref:DUF4350 domain-containing protein n=1 Tax=Nocardiopsis gilva YIM 90087 TaxID=1235441 RepID=A0A223SBK7_9ACTN|nr:DUF4350 domain-containing protein [Nocardiopsis gilva]ASU85475.1 DUF4350 domain-containing protein [Nocardiopsis gilva YIM 90087]